MSLSRTGKITGALGVAAAITLGGASLAQAATATPTPSASSTASTATTASPDKAVTGAAADKVIAAVKAAHTGVTITTVRQDADGSYDAIGTDASGNKVFYDVSADLKTITASTGHGGHGKGGGASADKAVTGAAADKVIAAVKAAHSGVTITTVRQDADGSYDAIGSDASGNKVFYDVSADLKTITASTGHGGHGSSD